MFKKLEIIGWENESQKDSDRYTIVRNHDKALKRQIVNMGDPKTLTLWQWGRKEWTIEGEDSGEMKLTHGRNVIYIPMEDYEKEKIAAQKDARNNEVDIIIEFFKQHGILHSTYDDKKYAWWSNNCIIGEFGFNNTGHIRQNMRSLRLPKDDGKHGYEIELSYQSHGSSSFFRFTKDGDFACRDYNIDIERNYNSQVQPDYQEVYDRFIATIKKFGPAKRGPKSKENLFYDGFALNFDYSEEDNWNKYEFKVNVMKPDEYGSYKIYRKDRIKEPKKMIDISVDEIIELIETEYLQKLKPKFIADDVMDITPKP